jgi:endonuclease/exonuclease/phosphatase family metal-dependent hydrolase
MSEVTEPIERSGSELIRFLTFNVRLDTVADEAAGNGWRDRLASVLETVRRADADVTGFQEVRRSQLYDLSEALSDRQGVGKPREAGDLGEYVPIFFRRSRFEREDGGDFWLSTTPETEGSIGWDASSPRHCTWVRLRDGADGTRFAVLNTHLDVRGALARVEAARLIATRSAIAPRVPTVVLGDMNAEEGSEPLEILRAAGFRDTFRYAHPAARDVQTVHHYVDLSGRRKIDYILCDAAWLVERADIIRRRAAGRLPADHYPVIADLRHRRAPDEGTGRSPR